MNTWEQVQPLHLKVATAILCREPTVAAAYREYLAAPRQERIDKIKDILAAGAGTSANGRAWTLLINDFPYWLEASIKHYVFWFVGDYSLQEALEVLSPSLGSQEVIIFCNTPNNRTIPDINHYHVLVRGNGAGSLTSAPYRIS